ncbi:MAG: Helix-turn-helix domain [Polyangiaceae bacterium]|nr:Helix-turn-helix domain [Polyangiaceae bacterium]
MTLTDDQLDAVRRVVAEELDAALSRHLAVRSKPRAGLLTLEEVAAVCHVSPETVRHWIWEGRLTAYKPGRAPLVKESELLAFVEANETTKKRVARRRR